MSGDEVDYCTQGFAGNSDYHCYRCLIKTPSAWCRNQECDDCLYNITNMLKKVFARGLALDIIPGGQSRALQRIEVYENLLEEIGDDSIEKFPNTTLRDMIRRVNGYASSSAKKSELVQLLQACLAREKEFYLLKESKEGCLK